MQRSLHSSMRAGETACAMPLKHKALGTLLTGMLALYLQDVALLPNVVRMVDYMLVEGALDMLVTTIEQFKGTMDCQAVIITQLSFADVGMNFNANEEETRQVGTGESVECVQGWAMGAAGLARCRIRSGYDHRMLSHDDNVTMLIVSRIPSGVSGLSVPRAWSIRNTI